MSIRSKPTVIPPAPTLAPTPCATSELSSRLDVLRAELADLAFNLERRGRLDAADAVMGVYARLDEIRAETRKTENAR